MPRQLITYLDGQNIYICRQCSTHLTGLSQLASKAFRGKTGTAYLFTNVQNITQGQSRDQQLATGLHKICSIYCIKCDNKKAIGWKYIKAYSVSQKYKEGKFILQKYYLDQQNWTDLDEIMSLDE